MTSEAQERLRRERERPDLITIKDGVQVEHHVDSEVEPVQLWLEPYVGGAIGRIGVRLTRAEIDALVRTLTWQPVWHEVESSDGPRDVRCVGTHCTHAAHYPRQT